MIKRINVSKKSRKGREPGAEPQSGGRRTHKGDSQKGLRIAGQRIGTTSHGGAGCLKREKSTHWLNAMKGQVRCKLQIYIGFIDDKRVINGLRQSFSGLMGTEAT